MRGIQRDDIRPGLRITSHRKRTAVAFIVDPTQVVILGVFYGGQDYEPALLEGEDEPEWLRRTPRRTAYTCTSNPLSS